MNVRTSALVLSTLIVAGTAAGRASPPTGPDAPSPRGDAVHRLLTPLRGGFSGQRLEDVLKYIGEVTGAPLEPMWADDEHPAGLDRERVVTLKFDEVPALRVLERVLATLDDGTAGGASTWQLSADGSVQVGPRARLNAFRRLEVYDVSDLTAITPDFVDAPTLDLRSALQGAGSGGSVFRDPPGGAENKGPGGGEPVSRQQRAGPIRDLVVGFVEHDQWRENGGDGAFTQVYGGAIIVSAPEYIHRQIGGLRSRTR